MKICPKCSKKFERLLAVSRTDNKTMICDDCGIMEAQDSIRHGILTPQDAEARTVCGSSNME